MRYRTHGWGTWLRFFVALDACRSSSSTSQGEAAALDSFVLFGNGYWSGFVLAAPATTCEACAQSCLEVGCAGFNTYADCSSSQDKRDCYHYLSELSSWSSEPTSSAFIFTAASLTNVYREGPRVGNNAWSAGCGSHVYSRLSQALEACDADPSCSFLHSYSCETFFWRMCTGSIEDVSRASADSGACTRVQRHLVTLTHTSTTIDYTAEFFEGPRVGNEVFVLHCGAPTRLSVAAATCVGDQSCQVLHNYGCVGLFWRPCFSSLSDIVADSVDEQACTKLHNRLSTGTHTTTTRTTVTLTTTTHTATTASTVTRSTVSDTTVTSRTSVSGTTTTTGTTTTHDYTDGPRLGNDVWELYCGVPTDLETATQACDADPACQVLHAFDCVDTFWRPCTGSLDAMLADSVDSHACSIIHRDLETTTGVTVTMTGSETNAYFEGPRVGNMAWELACSAEIYTLEEARIRCNWDRRCSFLHAYDCQSWFWRPCFGNFEVVVRESADSDACTVIQSQLLTSTLTTTTSIGFADSFRVGNLAWEGRCNFAVMTLEEALGACEADPGCTVLHSYDCEDFFWRYCPAPTTINDLLSVSPDRKACTKVLNNFFDGKTMTTTVTTSTTVVFVEGPRVGNGAWAAHCDGAVGFLDEAEEACSGDRNCDVVHCYKCQDWGCRPCSGATLTQMVDADPSRGSCTKIKHWLQTSTETSTTPTTVTHTATTESITSSVTRSTSTGTATTGTSTLSSTTTETSGTTTTSTVTTSTVTTTTVSTITFTSTSRTLSSSTATESTITSGTSSTTGSTATTSATTSSVTLTSVTTTSVTRTSVTTISVTTVSETRSTVSTSTSRTSTSSTITSRTSISRTSTSRTSTSRTITSRTSTTGTISVTETTRTHTSSSSTTSRSTVSLTHTTSSRTWSTSSTFTDSSTTRTSTSSITSSSMTHTSSTITRTSVTATRTDTSHTTLTESSGTSTSSSSGTSSSATGTSRTMTVTSTTLSSSETSSSATSASDTSTSLTSASQTLTSTRSTVTVTLTFSMTTHSDTSTSHTFTSSSLTLSSLTSASITSTTATSVSSLTSTVSTTSMSTTSQTLTVTSSSNSTLTETTLSSSLTNSVTVTLTSSTSSTTTSLTSSSATSTTTLHSTTDTSSTSETATTTPGTITESSGTQTSTTSFSVSSTHTVSSTTTASSVTVTGTTFTITTSTETSTTSLHTTSDTSTLVSTTETSSSTTQSSVTATSGTTITATTTTVTTPTVTTMTATTMTTATITTETATTSSRTLTTVSSSTTTLTSVSTETSNTQTSTTETSSTTLTALWVVGNIVVLVDNAEEFVADSRVEDAMTRAVASMAVAPVSAVSVEMSFTRRLRWLSEEPAPNTSIFENVAQQVSVHYSVIAVGSQARSVVDNLESFNATTVAEVMQEQLLAVGVPEDTYDSMRVLSFSVVNPWQEESPAQEPANGEESTLSALLLVAALGAAGGLVLSCMALLCGFTWLQCRGKPRTMVAQEGQPQGPRAENDEGFEDIGRVESQRSRSPRNRSRLHQPPWRVGANSDESEEPEIDHDEPPVRTPSQVSPVEQPRIRVGQSPAESEADELEEYDTFEVDLDLQPGKLQPLRRKHNPGSMQRTRIPPPTRSSSRQGGSLVPAERSSPFERESMPETIVRIERPSERGPNNEAGYSLQGTGNFSPEVLPKGAQEAIGGSGSGLEMTYYSTRDPSSSRTSANPLAVYQALGMQFDSPREFGYGDRGRTPLENRDSGVSRNGGRMSYLALIDGQNWSAMDLHRRGKSSHNSCHKSELSDATSSLEEESIPDELEGHRVVDTQFDFTQMRYENESTGDHYLAIREHTGSTGSSSESRPKQHPRKNKIQPFRPVHARSGSTSPV